MTGPKSNAEIDLFGGLAKGANIDPKNKVLVVNPSADKLKLTINP